MAIVAIYELFAIGKVLEKLKSNLLVRLAHKQLFG